MQTSFVQALITPLADPLCIISAHDGTIIAANAAMEAVAASMGTQVLVGENFIETAEQQGLEVEAMPTYKAMHFGGRHTHTIHEPIAVHVIASREDQYILCSAWQLDELESADWAHDWLWLGLKNAIQMDAAASQAQAASEMLASLTKTVADMQATYVERAAMAQHSPWRQPPSRPWRPLRSVE